MEFDWNAAAYYVDDVWLSHIDSAHYVSINEELEIGNYGLEVYPNPASGQVSIRLNGSSTSFGTLRTGRSAVGMTLKVVDVVGRDCFSRSLRHTQGTTSFAMTEVLDVGNWPDGVYVLMLTDAYGNRYTERLVVQH